MKSNIGALAALAACALSSGCASIVGGHNQSLSVETRANGAALTGAQCKLFNSKGTWFVNTPGSVIVHRAYGDLTVDCTHEKAPPGSMIVKSATKPLAFGNIIFGGAIGVGVDVATGAAYDYPDLISVEMGAAQVGVPPVLEGERKK